MESFIQGVLLGFGAAVPVGPINVLIMSYALKNFWLGAAIGFGAMCVDVFYLLLMSFGILKFLNNPIFLKILAIFGGVFLLYIAYLTLKSADTLVKANENLKENSVFSCFFKGVLINFVNPYIVGFWLSVSSFAASSNSVFMSVSGLLVAIMSWLIFLPFVVSRSRRFISQTIAKIFAYFSAALIAIFAVLLVYNTFFKG